MHQIMKFSQICLIALTIFMVQVHSYNILIMLPFGTRSHKNVFDPIAEALVRKGHKVTIMAPLAESKEMKGVTNVRLQIAESIMSNPPFSFFDGTMEESSFMNNLIQCIVGICNATYHEPAVLDIIRNPRSQSDARFPRYDLLVIDFSFNDHILPLGHLMGIPVVYISCTILLPHVAWSNNIPTPYSYVTPGMSSNIEKLTIVARAKNAFSTLYFKNLFHWTLHSKFEEIIRKYIPNSPSLNELERNVAFIMTNTNPAIHPARPSMPFTLEIGCVHCSPAQKLPQDFEDYLEQAGPNGVVYFSLGSVTKGSEIPEEMKHKVIEAFSQLQQNVLWKYEGRISNLPPNIRLVKWAPQQSLIGHPQVRLFISHGGGLSTQEAAYHGCPILGFPLSGDQLGNIAYAVRCGYAEQLDWQTFTAKDLFEKIQLMLKDSRYREKATEVSNLLKDNMQPPADAAAYWLEYVIRHKGATHLKSAAQHLNFFQYFLIDVIAVIFVAVLVGVVISIYVLKNVYRVIKRCLSGVYQPLKQKTS